MTTGFPQDLATRGFAVLPKPFTEADLVRVVRATMGAEADPAPGRPLTRAEPSA